MKTLEQKVLELGEAKARVNRLKQEFVNAQYECPNTSESERFTQSHFSQALDEAKAYREEHSESFDDVLFLARVEECSACLKAYNLMEERKLAVKALSTRKGVVLRAASKAWAERVQE